MKWLNETSIPTQLNEVRDLQEEIFEIRLSVIKDIKVALSIVIAFA